MSVSAFLDNESSYILSFNAAANLILIFLEGLSVNTKNLNVFWLPMNTVSHDLHLACKNDLKCIKNVLKIGYCSTKVEDHSTKKKNSKSPLLVCNLQILDIRLLFQSFACVSNIY